MRDLHQGSLACMQRLGPKGPCRKEAGTARLKHTYAKLAFPDTSDVLLMPP